MSVIPGLGLSSAAPEDEKPEEESRIVDLSAGSEWRFEIAAESSVTVKVLPASSNGAGQGPTTEPEIPSGTAEVFGTELAINHNYEFPGLTKAAVYTHYGCSLSITGSCESDYVAEETPMTEYLNLHFALENLRATAGSNSIGGPRVIILGPEDAGKTTLVKTLTAYATRSGRTPVVVNLDPHEGMLCLPGSVSAAAMGTGAVLDVEDAASNGWGSSPIGGPSTVPVKMPLVYQYGYAGPEERPDLFKPISTRLALAVTGRFSDDPDVREAGMLVDIAGSACSGKKGIEVVTHVISEFSINVIIILGSERLYSDMLKKFNSTLAGDEQVHVLRATKSGGCIDREEGYKKQLRHEQIRTYFFGTPKNTLSPLTISVDFKDLNLLKIADPNSINPDFLPGGAEDDDDDNKAAFRGGSSSIFETVTPSMALQSALLAVKHANLSDSHETIRDASVMGYLYVSDVDDVKQRLRILSPAGGTLPRKAIVWGPWEVGAGMGDLVG